MVPSHLHKNQLIYYAVSICTEGELLNSQALQQIINRCKMLRDYNPYASVENEFVFRPKVDLPNSQVVVLTFCA